MAGRLHGSPGDLIKLYSVVADQKNKASDTQYRQ